MWKKGLFGKGLFGIVLVVIAAGCAKAPVSQPARTVESCNTTPPLEEGTYVVFLNPGEGRFHRPDTAPPAQRIPNRGAAEGDEIK